ncbi:hypothetical protein ISCGN_010200 [Ixodes scapularis]
MKRPGEGAPLASPPRQPREGGCKAAKSSRVRQFFPGVFVWTRIRSLRGTHGGCHLIRPRYPLKTVQCTPAAFVIAAVPVYHSF